jgi:hypothetical protein
MERKRDKSKKLIYNLMVVRSVSVTKRWIFKDPHPPIRSHSYPIFLQLLSRDPTRIPTECFNVLSVISVSGRGFVLSPNQNNSSNKLKQFSLLIKNLVCCSQNFKFKLCVTSDNVRYFYVLKGYLLVENKGITKGIDC